jgi:hypothetical protein
MTWRNPPLDPLRGKGIVASRGCGPFFLKNRPEMGMLGAVL